VARREKAKPTPKIAAIAWEGDSHEVLSGWPAAIQIDLANALHEMRYGRPAPLEVRPMTSIGKGVFELKTEDQSSWYRLVYLARINDVIYVLDCFKKKTRKTEQKDLKRASNRLKRVNERLREKERDAKRQTRAEQAKPRH
jgi:phage-related protein